MTERLSVLIDENAVSKVQEHIEDAIQKGGTVLYGGQKVAELEGHFIQPTVIGLANDTMLCMNEETFDQWHQLRNLKQLMK